MYRKNKETFMYLLFEFDNVINFNIKVSTFNVL